MPEVRLIVSEIHELRDLLEGFPADLEIELGNGVPVECKDVGNLRSRLSWPKNSAP